MKAIIPVAGEGTRLRPHTFTIPKVLFSIAGRPIVEYLVDELLKAGIREFVFITGHLGYLIEDHLKKRYKQGKGKKAYPLCTFTFIRQEERQGLAQAVYLAKDVLAPEEDIIIVLGDTLFHTDFSRIAASKDTVLGVKAVDDPSRFGVVITEGTRVKKLVEKPSRFVSKLALVGIYKIRQSALLMSAIQELIDKDLRTKGEYQLTDALQIMIRQGARMKVQFIQNWYDCGKPETVLETNRILLKKYHTRISGNKNNLIIPPVHIPASVKLHHCIIGPNVTIGKDARLDNCVVENSIIQEGTLAKNMVLRDSLVGRDVYLQGRAHRLNIGDSTELITD